MHALTRNFLCACALLLLLAAFLSPVLNAQDDGPPNVLVIHREYLKPGKGGMLHEHSESAFVQAFVDAKSPYHYFALDSLSGSSRSLFLSSYNSFADWEKQLTAIRGDKDLMAKVDHASQMDGDLLTGYDIAVMALRPDLSLNKGHIEGTRFFEFTTFVVKPGRVHEFTELAHMYRDAIRKIDPQTHWDCFQVVYGNPTPTAAGGTTFAVVNLMKSLAETDQGMKDSDKLRSVLGAGDMQKLGDLEAASIASSSTSLFAINPRMSNPPSEWVTKEPGFWKVQ